MARGGGLKKLKINWKKVRNMKIKKLFPPKKIPASDQMKILWKFIDKHKLKVKKKKDE